MVSRASLRTGFNPLHNRAKIKRLYLHLQFQLGCFNPLHNRAQIKQQQRHLIFFSSLYVSIPYITGHKSNVRFQHFILKCQKVSIPYITGHKSNLMSVNLSMQKVVSIPYITGHKSNKIICFVNSPKKGFNPLHNRAQIKPWRVSRNRILGFNPLHNRAQIKRIAAIMLS